MTRVERALRQIVADLERSSHAFALVGGFAISARTEPRFTRDVDLVVSVVDDAAAEALLDGLARLGDSLVASASRLPPSGSPPRAWRRRSGPETS